MSHDCHKKSWLYQARRVNTQTAGGGGALATRITLPTGVTGRLVLWYAQGAASNTTLIVTMGDEDAAAISELQSIAAGVSRVSYGPGPGESAGTNAPTIESNGLVFGPGQIISFASAAALQTETLTVYVAILLSAPVTPTWDTTGSGGTPSLAASTISAANTMQLVIE